MAAKNRVKNKKDKTGENLPAPQGKDALRLIVGLFFTALSVYTLIALISYLFTWAQDQSLLSKPDIWSGLVKVENGAGMMGFLWANFLLSKLFGLGAFIIPFFFAAIAVYFLRIKKINIIRILFITVFGAIITSIFFSFVFGFTKFDYWFGNGVGGSYGYHVNRWLISMLGAAGAGILILMLLILWLITLNRKVVANLNVFIDRLFAPKVKQQPLVPDELLPVIESSEAAESSVEPVTVEPVIERRFEVIELGADSEDTVKTVSPELEVIPNEEIESFKDDLVEDQYNKQDEYIDDSKNVVADDNDDIADDNDDISDEELDDINHEEENDISEEISENYDPRLDLSNYKLPSVDLLDEYKSQKYMVEREELEKNNRKIVKTLNDYKIGVEKIYARTGPTVTLYEIIPSPGVRISQIKRLEDDIALSLAAKGVRIIAPIPGTNAVGIEVANDRPSIVSMRSLIEDPKFKNSKYDLPIVIGRTISNEAMSFDLAKMPHLLVAGATGQGKSVGLNAIITSLLYTKHPAEMKLVLVDPKKVELSLYSKLESHFLAKLPDAEEAIITDTQKVVYTLKSLTQEMDARYDLLKSARVRNIKDYNEKFLARKLNPYKGHRFMPYIVVIIDEFADLIMTAGREIEEPIARLAQLARAIGIHLVIATQRPTTNIITGLIKANFPARIAFRVISNIDSRTILDTTGANQLIGRGDMLISTGADLIRVQCGFVDTPEIERVVDSINNQQGYPTAHYLPEYHGEEGDASSIGEVDLSRRDKLFEDAAKIVVQYQQGSASLLQRKMNLGFNRAGRLIDQLEAAGIVGPSEGSKARQVIISDFKTLDQILNALK